MENTELIKTQTQDAILETLPNIHREQLSDESNIFNLGLGSIDVMTLINKLENTFDIQFSTHEINFDTFQNINTIVTLIQQKKYADK
jgi:acyl carrier protein